MTNTLTGRAALPLAAVLSLSLLGGCGHKDDTPDNSAAAPAASNTTPPGPPAATGQPTTPVAGSGPGGPAPVAAKTNGTQTTAMPAGAAEGGPGGTMNNKPSQNPNGAVGDAIITAKVKSAIIKDALGATGINVDTKSGVVALRGSVKTAADKAKAEADAKSMQGVTKVVNQLAVKP